MAHSSEAFLNYDGITIALHTDGFTLHSSLQELENNQVGIKVIEAQGSYDGSVLYTPSDAPTISYSPDERSLNVSGPIELFDSARALSFLAGHLAGSLGAIKNRRLVIHAAAVYSPQNNASSILLGEKGAGKTTLATRLCTEQGFELIGNDQVYVGLNDEDELITTEGSTWIDIRETAAKADPYIATLFQIAQRSDLPSWNNKSRLHPEDLGINTHAEESNVSSIFNVRLDKYQPKMYTALWTGVQRNLILHERVGRQITGQTTPFQDDLGNYLGSIPPIELEKTLAVRDDIVRAIIKTEVTEVFGADSKELAQFIAKVS